MLRKKTINDIPLSNKAVILRVDFNVPLKNNGNGTSSVEDDYRILKALPTIQSLLSSRAKIVLMSHVGRPGGTPNQLYSMKPIAQRLSTLLDQPVKFIDQVSGQDVADAAKALEGGEILVIENLRFTNKERDNDPEFGAFLGSLGEVYIQEAFGNLHRSHASMIGAPKHIHAYAGLLVENEVNALSKVVDSPAEPMYAVIGGSKISSKIDLIESMLSRAKGIVVGGAMANTFLRAQGHEIGKSVVDDQEIDEAKRIMRVAAQENIDIILPLVDVAVASSTDPSEKRIEKKIAEVSEQDMILDFGVKSVEEVKRALVKAKTIVWNGPLGMTELEAFEYGSPELATFLANHEAMTVIGGGDTAGFIHEKGMEDNFYHVSTGGGASLELLSGKELPGFEALDDR